MKPVIKIIQFFLITFIPFCVNLKADNVLESSILQFQMNRFYFPVGTESLVYKDCHYVVFDKSDTLLTGYIEASFLGVSYGYPLNLFYDSLNLDDYTVFIQTITIDSLSKINIGYTSPYQITFDSTPSMNDRIEYSRYENNFEMILDFESGNLDAFYSFSQNHTNQKSTFTVSFSAPYYIALIPNPSSLINRNTLLTTSLYYRYDPDLMQILFEGDNCHPVNCLLFNDSSCRRYYPYAPYKGQMLLKQNRPLPKRITIGITDQSWEKTAEYYADILSRDRIQTVIANKSGNSDLYLTPIPINNGSSVSSLRFIHNLLVNDTTKGYNINETINIIGNYISFAESATDTLTKAHYVHLAETGLWDEIGVFPLYQPTIFFTARDNIAGNVIDSTGFIDQNKLYKIILPERPNEVNP